MRSLCQANQASTLLRKPNDYGGRNHERNYQNITHSRLSGKDFPYTQHPLFQRRTGRTYYHDSEHAESMWSITEPSDALIAFIIEQGWDDIHMSRNDGFSVWGIGTGTAGGITPPPAPRPSSTRKLICPGCGQSVRATRAVNIICGDCFLPMVQI